MTSIVGTWRLVRGTATSTDGKALNPPYGGEKGMGRVTFNDDGRMMAVLCDGRPTLPVGETREYASYCVSDPRTTVALGIGFRLTGGG